MSLLVRYTLSSPDNYAEQVAAMTALVNDLDAEGIAGLNYSCFTTDDPTAFVGVLEYSDDATRQAFLGSAAFATYRERVKPILAGPPQTTDIAAVASTRD